MDPSRRVSPRKGPLSGDALQCGGRRLDHGYRWRRSNDRDGQGGGGVAFKNKRAELCRVSPDEDAVRQEAAFILDSEAEELSVWRTSEDDVTGVVGVFEKGGIGIFAAEAVCFSDLGVCRGSQGEKHCKSCNCRCLHSFPESLCSTPILPCEVDATYGVLLSSPFRNMRAVCFW